MYKRQARTRSQILDAVWKETEEIPFDRVIDVYIKELRKKLELDCIVTVRNVGYKLELSLIHIYLTPDEKKQVEDNIKKANPDLPKDTKIDVADDGTATITKPGEKPVTIPGSDLVRPKTDVYKRQDSQG